MDILYSDPAVIVCIKPAGVLSTDEPGGMPELVRREAGMEKADVRTVHRLDRVVGGLMVLAANGDAASELSRQIRSDEFDKSYYAVVHGHTPDEGEYTDLLLRNKAERKTYVVPAPGKGVQEARLRFSTLGRAEGMSLVKIQLLTGRTHQIRCQFSSRGFPLVGDRKYSTLDDGCDIALWSCHLRFRHPDTGEEMAFTRTPPETYPWDRFAF